MSVKTAYQRVRIETPAGPLVAVKSRGRLQVLQFEECRGELSRAMARLGRGDAVPPCRGRQRRPLGIRRRTAPERVAPGAGGGVPHSGRPEGRLGWVT